MQPRGSHRDDVGFDSIWVSEHHFSGDGYLPSLLPMLAALGVGSGAPDGLVSRVVGLFAAIGVPAIRKRSLMLTRRLIDAAQAAGYRLNTPTGDRDRPLKDVVIVCHTENIEIVCAPAPSIAPGEKCAAPPYVKYS